VDSGVPVNRGQDVSYPTALHDAVKGKNLDIIEFLIDAGADINRADGKGDTPLHYAAMSNDAEVVKALLKGGADASYKNDQDATPLDVAIENSSLDAENLLKEHRKSM
jgi:ankyrin repeat protein